MAANAAFVRHLSEKAMTSQDNDIPASYASPPCFMHELDQSYVALASESSAQQQRDVVRWRKAERERLIAERLTIDPEMRGRHAGQIVKGLDVLIGNPTGLIVSAYWPFRGEPDLRPWIDSIHARGGQFALRSSWSAPSRLFSDFGQQAPHSNEASGIFQSPSMGRR
jgi:hypothetical protein